MTPVASARRKSRRPHFRERRYVFAAAGAPSDAGEGGASGWNCEACRRVVNGSVCGGRCHGEDARVLHVPRVVLVMFVMRVMLEAAPGGDEVDRVLLAHCRHIASGRSMPRSLAVARFVQEMNGRQGMNC